MPKAIAIWAGVLVATVATSTATAQEGSTEIVVRAQSGMAGVTLGDTTGSVLDLLGPPLRRSPDLQPGPVTYQHWFYPGLRVSVISYQGRGSVLGLSTASPSARTSRGFVMGGTLAALRRAHPAVRCRSERRQTYCTIGEPGSRQTGFDVRKGRVRAIGIADVF